MRAILLAGVFMAVGCGNEPIQDKNPTELDKWQGEWKNTSDSKKIHLKVKGESVELLTIDPDWWISLDGKTVEKKMRLRFLPAKDGIGQVDLVNSKKTIYQCIYIWNKDRIEIAFSWYSDRPKDFKNSFLIKRIDR